MNLTEESRRPVAILGGGQLARMLALAAYPLGLEPRPLAAHPDEPAARVCPHAVFGSVADPVALRRLLSQCALAVFENEFVDTGEIATAAEGLSVRFVPSLAVIARLQDKLRQKELLSQLGVASPAHAAMPAEAARDERRALAWAREAIARWPGGGVLKWAQLGYDGYGTWIQPAPGAWPEAEVREFLRQARGRGVAVFAEQKVDFRRELALTACRSATGEFAAYPLVITRQERGVCREVRGPATRLGVDARLEAQARDAARRVAEALGIVGVFALEFFETSAGGLVVNELAPRVHNSSHYSLDAGMASQFENHWRAALGLPLGPVMPRGFFAMRNLLGPREVASAPALVPVPFLSGPLRLHWYDKGESRPGRKLGHLNVEAVSEPELEAACEGMAELEARWSREIAGTHARRHQES